MKLSASLVWVTLTCLLCVGRAQAFVERSRCFSLHGECRSTSLRSSMRIGDDTFSRDAWVGRVLGTTLVGAAVGKVPPALADLGVGEGGLPDGARQFSTLVRINEDWRALGKTFSERGSDLSSDEWSNVALFLRKVYQAGDDLNFLAKGFDPTTKKTALALVSSIQKEVEAADKPARAKDVEKFLTAQRSVQEKLEKFMDLFIDVPSEL